VFCNQRFGDATNGYSMWTVIFPSDQLWGNSQHRPIVIMPTGYGMSNNAFLFKEQRTYLAKVVEDYKCILVVANCGGTEAMGTHSNIAGHLETLISYFHDYYGGDRNKMVFWGGSRGGFCSLFWGANPYNKNYTTVGIFADMPPIELGTMAYMPVANYINMGNIHNIMEGEYTIDSQGTIHDTDSDVWRYTNRYASHCQAMTGTTNKTTANLVGPLGYVSNYAGKIVSYNVGTNDTVIPFDGFQKLIQAFEAQSIAQSQYAGQTQRRAARRADCRLSLLQEPHLVEHENRPKPSARGCRRRDTLLGKSSLRRWQWPAVADRTLRPPGTLLEI
jgi:hypothetical protein